MRIILLPPTYVPDELNPQPIPIFSTPKSHRSCIDLRGSSFGGGRGASCPACPLPPWRRRCRREGAGANTQWKCRGQRPIITRKEGRNGRLSQTSDEPVSISLATMCLSQIIRRKGRTVGSTDYRRTGVDAPLMCLSLSQIIRMERARERMADYRRGTDRGRQPVHVPDPSQIIRRQGRKADATETRRGT